MERFAVFILVLATVATVAAQKRYRNDYVYDAHTDAFYKFHINMAMHWRALTICKLEGATLMVPTSVQQIAQVHGMFKQYPDMGDYVWIGDDNADHESAEETPIIDLQPEVETEAPWEKRCVLLTRRGEIQTRNCRYYQPFVCMVEAKNAPYDQRCDVYAAGYEYNTDVKSCYKIPRDIKTWNAAYAECQAHGAHLVVVNSVTERDVMQALMSRTPYLRTSFSPYYYIAGIRATSIIGSEVVYRTIFNETLEEAGFSEWADNEPNNQQGIEYCGSLHQRSGKYNDISCLSSFGYICEKERNE
ncbi:secretory phospholipase A2 receptor-like isoform X1 [Ostrinia furnacalis]|uniref:secretory phospholipase A2 receptor-like isoform X1 n=2 Tax=Ostrinia furnacalis TaxID=93504 RepID=UPI0010400AB5|nr:secretory phospholipase A2 receptor-like isoform X1 [Ostrinia furnacalis]